MTRLVFSLKARVTLVLLVFAILVVGAVAAQTKPQTPKGTITAKIAGTVYPGSMAVPRAFGPLLYDQTGGSSGNNTASQIFPDFGDASLESADDFVVPAEGWNIGGIVAEGQYSIAGPASIVTVRIYPDNAGLPDATAACAYEQIPVASEAGGILAIELDTVCSLAAGTYWLNVMPYMSFAGSGQWYWNDNLPVVNSEGAFQDPTNLLGSGQCGTWTPFSTCPLFGTAFDLSFQLYGPSVPDEVCIDEVVIYSTDHEDGSGDWTASEVGTFSSPWSLNTDGGASGANYWGVPDLAGSGSDFSDARLDSPTITIPGGATDVYVRFTHYYGTESTYDGGVLELSINSGSFTYLDGSAFTQNGYTGPISGCCLNPLGGLNAFHGNSPSYPSYIESQADLPVVAGDDVVIRFREANDFSVSADGWYLDDVEVGYCAAVGTETPIFSETPTLDVTATPTDTETPVVTETATATDGPSETPTATELPGTELIQNGDFEVVDTEGKPVLDPWVVKNSSGDKGKCNKDKDGDGIPDKIFANTGNCAFVFKGVPGDAGKLEQTIDLTGVTLGVGDALNLTFAAQTKGGGLGKAKVVFKYGDDTKTKISVNITDTTDVYAPFAGSEALTSTDVTKSKLSFKMTTDAGKVYVDGVSLRLVSAGGGATETPTDAATVSETETPTDTPAPRLNGSRG